MLNNLDKYILEAKTRLDKNYLSPLFIRFANLLYVNELYEECIAVCKTGLDIYPRYLTAKLILLKAFLKTEYLNEAELLLKEIKSKITNKDLLTKLLNNIQSLRTISKQEKIYYQNSVKNKFDYKAFEKKFQQQENLFSDYSLDELFSDGSKDSFNNDKQFQKFLIKYESFHFDLTITTRPGNTELQFKKQSGSSGSDNDFLNKIRIVTETLADIYSQQGNYNEAFDAYNILLRAGSSNSKRIEEKLHELERNMQKYDKI